MAPCGGDSHPADKTSSRTHDCFASLAMTGSQMGVVDSSIVGRRQSYGRPDFLARIIQPLLCGLNRMQSGTFLVADVPQYQKSVNSGDKGTKPLDNPAFAM